MEKVYIPKDPHEKAMQRALMQYRKPEVRGLVIEALRKTGRTDLIGFSPKCLVRPEEHSPRRQKSRRQTGAGKGKGKGKA